MRNDIVRKELGSYLQKKDEIDEMKRRNEIEARKLQVMQQQQKSGEKLKYCPHCGKPLP